MWLIWKDVFRLSAGVLLLFGLCLASFVAQVVALPITWDCQCEATGFTTDQWQCCIVWTALWPLVGLIWSPLVGWIGGVRFRPVAILLSVLSGVILSAFYLCTDAAKWKDMNGIALGSPSRAWLIAVAWVFLAFDIVLAVWVAHRFIACEARKTVIVPTGDVVEQKGNFK